MTQDIANLGIKIDTSDLAKAERDLDGLNQAGQKTEESAKKVGSAWEKAAGKISGDTGEIVRQLQALNKTQSATIQALAGLDKTVSKFGSGFAQASARINATSSATEALARTEKESASAFKIGGDAAAQQQQALARLLGQIDPVVAAMARLDAQQDELQKNRNLGLIDAATFDQFKTKIDASRASLAQVNTELKRSGITASQTSAALRMLPAQFTDIFVSLSAGQSPLQVLLQQGGQIKDSFGGIGPALRETGRYALALVNPFTLAAVAVGALAFAYKQGSDEATAYNKAIILTGNYAGTSADQLETLAQQLDNVGGTQRQNAGALAELVGTGRFASRQLENLTDAAVAMENATGKAISETVAEYVKLADAPVTAILELNKSQRFLTAEIYSQIVALEEAGRTTEAADLALKSYSDTMQSRASQVVDNLGAIEGAWEKVKKGAAEAWDEVLAVGREQTIDERLAELRKRVAEIQSGGQGGRGRFGLGIVGRGDASAELQEIKDLELKQKAQNEASEQARVRATIEADAVSAISRIDALGKAAETNAEKRKKALEQLARDIEKIRLANPNDARLSPDKVAKLEADIAEKFKDPKAARAPQARDDAATRMLMTLREQQATLQEQLGTETKLTEAQRARARFESLIADLKEKKVLTADQKSLQANQEAIRAQLDKNVSIAEEVRLQTESLKLQERSAQLQQTIAASSQGRREQYDRQLSAFGKGSQAQQQAAEAANIFREFRRYQDELNKSTPKDLLGSAQYMEARDQIGQGLRDALSEHENYYKRLEEMQGDWVNGASQAFADYSERARDIAGQTQGLIGGSLETLTQGFGDSVAQAIVYGKDLEDSMRAVALTITTDVIGALAEMAARQAINYALDISGAQTAAAAKTAAVTETTGAQLAAMGTVAAAGTAATAKTVAEQGAAATAVTAEWTPAATVASIGSFGTAAAIGLAAVIAAIAAAKGGFKKGGYTGDMSASSVAGVVHGKEFVFDAAATSRIGVENLEKLRSGREIAKTSSTMANAGAQERAQFAALNARIESLNVRPIQNFNVTTPNADSFRLSERQITRRARQRIS